MCGCVCVHMHTEVFFLVGGIMADGISGTTIKYGFTSCFHRQVAKMISKSQQLRALSFFQVATSISLRPICRLSSSVSRWLLCFPPNLCTFLGGWGLYTQSWSDYCNHLVLAVELSYTYKKKQPPKNHQQQTFESLDFKEKKASFCVEASCLSNVLYLLLYLHTVISVWVMVCLFYIREKDTRHLLPDTSDRALDKTQHTTLSHKSKTAKKLKKVF